MPRSSKMKKGKNRVVVSNMFFFHPYLGKLPILTNIFQLGLKPPTRKRLFRVFFGGKRTFLPSYDSGQISFAIISLRDPSNNR